MPSKVIVVGAGWFGLVAAKTYLQVDPTIDLTVLESEDTIGGTWSRSRVYPTLLAQQPNGRYEFADLPIGESNSAYTPGTRLHAYMNEYAEKFGVLQHIRFQTTVSRIVRNEDGRQWDIWINGSSEALTCDKLIVATGLTSAPITPNIPSKGFASQVFHTKELGTKYEFITSPVVNNVTVYGGGKSAIDCVYSCVAAGKHVNWVIRTEGGGMPAFYTGGSKGRVFDDVAGSRFGSKLHPSLQADDWWHWALHSGKNPLGRWAHWKFCEHISKTLHSDEYTKSENMAKLAPVVTDHCSYWLNTSPAVITQPEVLEWIHKGEKITIHRETIVRLEGGHVHLSNGETHQADAVIYATGYDVIQSCFSLEDSASLGLPVPLDLFPADMKSKWDTLESNADQEIITRFPRLASPPEIKKLPVKYSPYRLWRNMVPLPLLEKESPDRSLVFAGIIRSFSTAITSEAMALWTVAWMTGRITPNKTMEEFERDVAMTTAFSRRRYLNLGFKLTYQLFEFLPIVDSLLEEAGLKSRRKKGAYAELFEPYLPKDYRGITEEFKAVHGIRDNDQKFEERSENFT